MTSVRAPSHWLWRVLLPSWRLFEAEGDELVLEVRTQRGAEAPSPFAPAIPPAPRGPLALLFAPQHNLRLACHDLITRLLLELGELGPIAQSELEALPSYRRVRHMARYFLREAARDPSALRFQLRLRAREGERESDEIFLSPYYPLA